MLEKRVLKEDDAIKNTGKCEKFGLDNPREGGGVSWEIQEIPLVEWFERI